MMLNDSQLKIYQSLDIDSEFNIGLLILYIIEGSSKILINGQMKEYEANELIIINDLQRYEIKSNKNTIIASLYISREELDAFYNFNKKYFINTEKLDSKLLKINMIDLITCYVNPNSKNLDNIIEQIHQLMTTLHEYRILDDKYNLSEDIDVRKGFDYMYAHCKEKLYFSDVARNGLLTERNLSKKLREVTGLRYLELLKMIRLSHCTFDLMYTKKCLAQIASENGYANEGVLIDLFRNRYGITPARFRKQMMHDTYYTFHHKHAIQLKNFDNIHDQLKQLTNQNIGHVNINIREEDSWNDKIRTPNLLIYITNIETLTNYFQQSKLLSMRREMGQYNILFSYQLFKDICRSDFESNKRVHQMFSFILEHQFDISFEIKLCRTQKLVEYTTRLKRLLNYLTDCTYFYGPRTFKFYIDATYQQFDKISQIIKENLKDTIVTLVMNSQNNYLAKRMSHKMNDNKQITYKVHREIEASKNTATILKNNPSVKILYQPKIPNKIESLISIVKWSIKYSQVVSIIIDDTWIDSMIPSQSSHLIIKELQLNTESQYQFFELLLTLIRLRGEIVYYNGLILMTKYMTEYQIIVFPNLQIIKEVYQRINVTDLKLGDIEYRHQDFWIKSASIIKHQSNTSENTYTKQERIYTKVGENFIFQFYTTPDVIKHIYIKQKIN